MFPGPVQKRRPAFQPVPSCPLYFEERHSEPGGEVRQILSFTKNCRALTAAGQKKSTRASSAGGSMDMPGLDYTMIEVGVGAGGMMKNQASGAPDSWLPYVLFDDAAASTRTAAEPGAKVLKDVTEVPGLGWGPDRSRHRAVADQGRHVAYAPCGCACEWKAFELVWRVAPRAASASAAVSALAARRPARPDARPSRTDLIGARPRQGAGPAVRRGPGRRRQGLR